MNSNEGEYQLSVRNLVLGITNGSVFRLSWAMLDPETVLTAFALQLTRGSILSVGIIASVIMSGWYLPEALLAPFFARKERLLPYYWASAAARVVLVATLWAVVRFWRPEPPLFMFAVVTLLLFAYTTAGGAGMLPFFSIVSDTIPPTWRGRFFGARWLIGGLLAFGAGFFIKHVLGDSSGLSFPDNYALLFLCGTVALALGVGAFCLAEEYPRTPQKRRLPFRTEMARGPRFFRKDKNYRRVIRARALFTILSGLSFPFIVPYALQSSNMTTAMLGVFLALRELSFSLSNLVWSPMSDRQGNLKLLLASGWLTMLLVLATLIVPLVPHTPLEGSLACLGDLRVAYFLLLAILLGTARAGALLGHNNYLLELTPNRVRPTYLAFYYAILFPLCWVPLVGSIVIGQASRYTLGFAIALVLGMGMMMDLLRLSEVRENAPESDAGSKSPP